MLVSRGLDGDLAASETAFLHEHIICCQECMKVNEQYLRLRTLLRTPMAVVEPVLDQAHVSRSFWQMGWKIAAMLAVCIGVLGTLFLARNDSGDARVIHIIDKTLYPYMNTPIGALAYYRHFAGHVVQTQFFSISAQALPSMRSSLSDSVLYSYRSPLFQDKEAE